MLPKIHDDAYLDKLIERGEYFNSKTITELEREEIEEYLRLKGEVKDLIETITKAWDNVWDVVQKTREYQERVGRQ